MVKRLDRAKRSRSKIRRTGAYSIIVTKSSKHTRVQLLNPEGIVMTGVSTLSPEVRKKCANGGNVAAAKQVGLVFAKMIKALKVKIEHIAFDRSGYKYHGRVMAVAEGVREGGIAF